MSRRDHRSRPVEAVKRPEAAEARRLRAAELLTQGRSQAEVAAAVGASRESVRRWQALLAQGGVAALRRRRAGGRPPKLSDAQAARVEQALRHGAKANGFATDLWTLDRVAQVVEHHTGVRLARESTWRLLVGRLGWSLQRPERQARERDEKAIARWVAYEWPRIKKERARNRPGWSSSTNRASRCCRSPAGPGRPGARRRSGAIAATGSGPRWLRRWATTPATPTAARGCVFTCRDSDNTQTLIGVLEQLAGFYAGQQVVLLWDRLPAHWSHDMHAWLDTQRHWLQVERLPAYAPELNAVEYLWANLKGIEVADAAEQGIGRVCETSSWSGRSWPTPA